MLIGQFSGMVGSGNRVSFPKKFRQSLGDRLILTKGLDGNIIIVGFDNGSLLTEGIETQPFSSEKARELQTFILGNAHEVVLDGLGRFVIPEHLRKHAEIDKEVVFTGIQNYVQLWDKRRFSAKQRRIEKRITTENEELPGKE